MCGIFGYIGKQNTVDVVLAGLKKLEYRGYDSAGIAGICEQELFVCKEVGKIQVLEKAIDQTNTGLDLAIAHTRWATHGKPTRDNAHPHFDAAKTVAVVHNGIVENYESIRQELVEEGISFLTQTDTEVIAQLVAFYYSGNFLEAVKKALSRLEGSFACAFIHKDFPDQILAVAHQSPLVIGVGDEEVFLSSDSRAFINHTRKVIYLSNGEIAQLTKEGVKIFGASSEPVFKDIEHLTHEDEEISKGSFDHYTLKEIFEQPQTIRCALLSRYIEEYGQAVFEEITFDVNELLAVERILILACGTSWHAGAIASYMIEEMAGIPVQVEISSEFRYKNPIVKPGTFVVAISQSGETADTIAAVRELKAKGAHIMGICNVHGSTLEREADCTLFLRAGPEIGVCSTKAFTSQVIILSLFSLLLSRMRHMTKDEGRVFLNKLLALPDQVKQVLDQADHIQNIAKKWARYDNFFFIGRCHMYPTALEGALKLKEISYINANGYAAGEMKHGPIALINESCPTVALFANSKTYDKMISNVMEVKARSGPVIAIAQKGDAGVEAIADDIIWVPRTSDALAAIPTSVATQLFAYFVAKERGEDIDQPRNLAKSVTVE